MARFLFFDWETQSDSDLPICGTLNYVLDPSTRVLLKSWCVDQDGPVKLWVPDLSAELAPEVWAYILSRVDAWGPPPAEIIDLFAADEGVYVVAWNAAFDRHVWQQVATPENGFPSLHSEQVLDAMAQAQASNLPGQLDWAGRMLGLGQKTLGGKALMKRFANRHEPLPGAKVLIDAITPRAGAVQKAIEDWALYLDYGGQDTNLMRSVWYTTRPLDEQEWREYWTSERINDRGMLADLDVCAGAVLYREEESEFVADECKRLTDGVIERPTLTAQINAWLYEQLPSDLAQHIIKAVDEETGEVTKLSGNKQALGRLLEDIYVSDAPPPDNVTEFIELLQFGRSSSAVKFEKILNQQVDGRLTNSYVFNGAGQTGRMCVAPETMIETPKGPRRIVDLQVSDKVITHLGRAQRVEAIIYKGRELMFDLTGPNGEFVTATLAHRVLTEQGWKALYECFEKTSDGHWALREGLAPISFAGNAYGADRGDVRGNVAHSVGDPEGALTSGRASTLGRGLQIAQQDGRREPNARPQDGRRAHTEERPSGSVERGGLYVRASADRGEDVGVGDVAGTSGSSPHRRGQVEQQSGQSGGHDKARPSVLAQAGSWTLVPVGEREVWDITVARDASYIAQGIAHHNSSRGVQIHNLPRDKVPNELDVLDMIAARVPIEELRKLPLTKDDMKKNDRGPTSVNALLARLIRPTFYAPEGKLMVWGDWSAIEARVTPWLANTRDADRAVLDAFRNGDDLYLLNAESIFHTPYDILRERYENGDPEAKGMRQAGKVAVLALGFLGGVGALRAMARGYGMRLTDEEAKLIVDGWRERNRWARRFGDKCEEAAFAAVNKPMQMFIAGRVKYQYVPGLMGGTLICYLPDMRPIVYPKARIATVEKFGKEAKAITYLNGMGYRSLWNGLLVENCLAGDTRVVTNRGVVRLDDIRQDDLIWDGVDFVRHSRLACKGAQAVIDRWGVRMTPDHKVLTADGWKAAQDCEGPDRANVRLPDDVEAVGTPCGARQAGDLVGALRVWQGTGSPDGWVPRQPETVAKQLRVQDTRTAFGRPAQSRDVGAPSLLGMAVDGRPLHAADAPRMGELRRARYHRLRALANVVFELLGRHGRRLLAGADYRPERQQRGVLSGQLSVGHADCAGAQYAGQSDDRHVQGANAGRGSSRGQRDRRHDAPLPIGPWMDDGGAFPPASAGKQVEIVYDLVDCGPRNRFVVLDENGIPFLVHNCTQATAASILRGTLVRLEEEEKEAQTVGDTHDEIICEVPEASAESFAVRLEEAMVRGFDWSTGLPLAAEVEVDFYYHK